MTTVSEEKEEFNERAKASMRDFLRSKSWVQKVQSIERMKLASKAAKNAMREKLAGDDAPVPALPDVSAPTTATKRRKAADAQS